MRLLRNVLKFASFHVVFFGAVLAGPRPSLGQDPFSDRMRSAPANPTEAGKPPLDQDAKFVVRVLHDSQLAVEYARAALGRTTSDAVRQRARFLEDKCGALSQQLTTVSDQLGVTARAGISSGERHRAALLSQVEAGKFEQEFLSKTQEMTQNIAKACSAERTKSHDRAMQSVAQNCLDVVQQ